MMAGNKADLAVTMLDLSDRAQAHAADAYVMGHADSTPFHRPAWMQAMTQATGHRAIMLAAVGPSGRISGVLPLHYVKSRLFGAALVSSAFAVDGGILADNVAALAALAQAAQGLARERGGLSLELRGLTAEGAEAGRLLAFGLGDGLFLLAAVQYQILFKA